MIVVVTNPERKIVAVTKLKIRIAVTVKERSFYKEEWERRCQQAKHILKIVTSVIFILWTPDCFLIYPAGPPRFHFYNMLLQQDCFIWPNVVCAAGLGWRLENIP